MVVIFLANGFEETEAIAPIDIMRRAGLQVLIAGVGGKRVRSSHGVVVTAEVHSRDLVPDGRLEAVVLPGGMPGTLSLEESEVVQQFIDYAVNYRKVIGAICAAPSILGHKNLLEGKRAVCYPGFERDLIGATVLNGAVEVDGNIITACGAGAALEFGFTLVERLCGKEKRQELEQAMQCGR